MRLEHVGIAVRDAESTISLLHTLLRARPYKSESVASEGVLTVFFDAGGPKLELVVPERADSPVARHLERRGEGLHHLAFEVDDIDAAFQRLAEAGFRLLNEAPKAGADGMRIFFLHPKDTGGVLVELCQRAPGPLSPTFVELAGRRLAVYQAGRRDSPPLVLLHAAMGTAELELRELARALEHRYRTIAIDLAGHGRSDDLPGDDLALDHFADDVAGVLRSLKVEQACVFGFSMGGAIALRLAARWPECVGGLAVHATTSRWDVGEAEAMAEAMDPDRMAAIAPERATQLAAQHGDRWRDLAHRMARFVRSLPDHPILDDDLAEIGAPTLVSHGDADSYFGIERALHLWRTIPRARLAVHPGIGHSVRQIPARVLSDTLSRFFSGAEEREVGEGGPMDRHP